MPSGKIPLLVAVLMASVALAQPFVNAPLLPLYNYVDGNNTEAVVGAVLTAGYVFTANSNGVYAMNTSAPTGTMAPFWDALPGVTQMWAYGTNMSSMGVIAIAGSTVALYKMNMTTVWREATLMTKNATFNLQTDSSSYGPSYQYPAMVANPMGGWMFVLGTRNTSSFATAVNLPSTVYAVNPVDLSIVWMTQVNSDSTNFAPSFCSEFVWVLTQNCTFGYSTVEVRKLYLTNGAMTWWKVDTGYSSLTYFNVQYDQFMVLNTGGYYDLYWLNGSHIVYKSIPTCGTMPYAPIVINSTWFAICGSNIYMYNNMTFAYSMFSANSNIRCGAIHEYNHDFILSGRDVVYVGNASGVFTLATLPAPATYSSYSYCTGAMFDYWSPSVHAPQMVLDILHLSFTGSGSGSGGSVLTMDYRTGEIHFQAAGNVDPFGAAIVDFRDHRMFVASTDGPILQGYDFVNVHNTTNFVVDMSSTSSKYFSIAYNATNRSTYYVSSNALYSIDWMGNSQQVGTVSLYTSNVAPVMIGQYLVVFDSYYGNAYVYDSVAKTMKTVSTCDLDEDVTPVVSKMMLILFCTSSSTTANVFDVSATTPTVKEISASNYRQANGAIVLGTTLIITTGGSTVKGFDMTTAMSTATWTTPSSKLTLVISPIVEYMNNGYFVAYAQSPSSFSFATYVYRVSSGGSLTEVGELKTNTDTSVKRLIIKSGGVFGGAVMYVIGYTNIAAYTTSWSMMFNYKSTSGSIQTMYQNNPVVLDSGAVCFYTYNGWFNVIGGFEGALAWRYPSQTGLYYPVLTDNSSIFFTDGQSVIGADVYSGAISSVSTYLNGNTRGFAIAAGPSGTTVIGATDDEIIFANQVNRYQSAATNFPGSSSAPGGSTFGDDVKSKVWIAGVVFGVIVVSVVVAVVVFVMKRGGGSSTSDVTDDRTGPRHAPFS